MQHKFTYNSSVIKEQESVWFRTPNWDMNRRTDEVFIIFKTAEIANKTHKLVEEFLEYYKLTPKDRNRRITTAIQIDILNKKYSYTRGFNAGTIAIPSQLPLFYESNKSTLIGRKFGL